MKRQLEGEKSTSQEKKSSTMDGHSEEVVEVVPDISASKTDFRDYYCNLRNQQNMLEDYARTGAYYNGIMQNAENFKGKVVLDVGAGSGILSLFAAQAGAKTVYACEASGITKACEELVKGNGFEDVIKVVKGRVEEIELPEKVDVIISEPLGVLLLHERMCESYVEARLRFLKPNGVMFPRNATIKIAPFADALLYAEQMQKTLFWQTPSFYGVNLQPLQDAAVLEHFNQPVVGGCSPDMMLAPEVDYLVDFSTCSKESLFEVNIPFRFVATRTDLLHGVCCWFDLSLGGSTVEVVLSTGPGAPVTHWQQCRLLFTEPIAVNASQAVVGNLHMQVNDHLSYDLVLDVHLEGCESVKRKMEYRLQNQHYRFDPEMTGVLEASQQAPPGIAGHQ